MTEVDSIIKIDSSQILRYNFLHYTIDEALRSYVALQNAFCLFYDSIASNHVFIHNFNTFEGNIKERSSQTFNTVEWFPTSETQSFTKHIANTVVLEYISGAQFEIYKKQRIVSIDQIRAKCNANLYMEPEELLEDLFKIISWNQIFRAKSANSYIYITKLLDEITKAINKKKFHKRFATAKIKDFQRLISYELRLKAKFEKWPYVPEQFREYEEISSYVPTPQKRSEHIFKRMETKKAPIECPEDCVCFSTSEDGSENFCTYSLLTGWVSKCPNRVNKIECNHNDPEKAKKCRNCEIKKNEKKKCKKNELDLDEANEIEECMMWGLDYYTRNIVYNCLPEVDIELNEIVDNKENKNKFIEDTLLKAINFNGREGYDMKKACLLILRDGNDNIDEKEKPKEVTENSIDKSEHFPDDVIEWDLSSLGKKNEEKNGQDEIFTAKDKHYAEVLLKNYEFCVNKIDNTAFRIHTKGKGARCIKKEGIKQGSFIVEYYGELYEPWRWYEREDFIKEVMKKKKLKNYIPEFYNIYLECHKDDPEGYDLMVVDPNKKGNFSSRFSHSCNPNCGTVATISDGKYYIGMYSFRDIKYGEELTFDYCCMTESNYEHVNSICLCGTQRCRGNYLELANSKTYSQLVDKNTCFFSRNSLILQALEPMTAEDYELCRQFNIKERMLDDSPEWIKKWSSKLLKYIQSELILYENELINKWTKNYPWEKTTPEIQAANIKLYAETSKNDLFGIRFQNLFTTIDKLKYFLNTIQSSEPPLYYLTSEEIVGYMIAMKDSILNEIEEVLIEQERTEETHLIQKFKELINLSEDDQSKLFYFRLCCLCLGHMCLSIQPTNKFNSLLFADIIYFYSFTHTYFTAREYNSHTSEEIKVALSEITGNLSDGKHQEKIKKRYSSQFVWGQLISWYKQTIVNPEASLSQDRRGTLSYPMIKTTAENIDYHRNSMYPFEKHCRSRFYKALKEKSSSSWPPAPDHGCFLSFKNTFKCYGTVFFESVHNSEKFKEFDGGSLQESVLTIASECFNEKIELFKKVEAKISGIGELNEKYDILNHIEAKYFKFNEKPTINDLSEKIENKPEKRKKRERSESSSS